MHADHAGSPATEPLSAAPPSLNPDIDVDIDTFERFTHSCGVHLEPDTKHRMVVSQTPPTDDAEIGVGALGEWNDSLILEEGSDTPPLGPGSEDDWSLELEALTYCLPLARSRRFQPRRPGTAPVADLCLRFGGSARFVLRISLLVAPRRTRRSSARPNTPLPGGGTQMVTVTRSADP